MAAWKWFAGAVAAWKWLAGAVAACFDKMTFLLFIFEVAACFDKITFLLFIFEVTFQEIVVKNRQGRWV